MITKISCSTFASKGIAKNAPSFGLARLNAHGKNAADKFNYAQNEFNDPRMFKKQGMFVKSALANQIQKGADFLTLCKEYGCTNNGKANAEFIKSQILTGKSDKAIQSLHEEARTEGLITLFKSNYDNPNLSLKETKKLLEIVKKEIGDEDYVKYTGLLQVGADK